MAKDKHTGSEGGSGKDASDGTKPDWANGLKKLYDSVVDEPLPDAFQDLLAKLDNGEADNS